LTNLAFKVIAHFLIISLGGDQLILRMAYLSEHCPGDEFFRIDIQILEHLFDSRSLIGTINDREIAAITNPIDITSEEAYTHREKRRNHHIIALHAHQTSHTVPH